MVGGQQPLESHKYLLPYLPCNEGNRARSLMVVNDRISSIMRQHAARSMGSQRYGLPKELPAMEGSMKLTDARVRNLRAKVGSTERLVADCNGLSEFGAQPTRQHAPGNTVARRVESLPC